MAMQYISIQKNLANFYQKWNDYSKNERKGYQTFMTDFFHCFGIMFDDPNKLPFEENTGKGFADAYIKDVVIVEMKDRNKFKNKSDLLESLPQALRYWEGKGKHVPYLVLSNFQDFIIYDTRDTSKYHLKLAELENKVESFNFLLKLNPTFVPEQEAVTRKSARLMGKLYQSLKSRKKGKDEDVDLFVLQCLFCLFSEDIGYLPAETFTNCVRRIKDGEDNSANILSTLFKMMDEKDTNRKRGRFENVRYFNGPLFRIKPEIVLDDEEVELLWQSCQMDWKNVRPEIFGALFESSQSKKARHKDGMHFTSEEDIMKVIRPCILEPWNEAFSKCHTAADYRELHKRMKSYRVLDPACGSGNFLVVAYRELKALESKIFMEYKRLSGESYNNVQDALEWIPVTNMYGIEINQFPSFLTRVSLWITKKLVKNQYKLTEPDLPLEELKHVIAADALEVKWDDVDVVVGNPPYIGCKMIRKARGDEYFEWLGKRFKDHNKMSDYCTYWFEKVLEDVRPGVRVGLVCTKTISQNKSRTASLDKVGISGGTIFNAISKQKWSGEAQVTVSIVNFINKADFPGAKILDGNEVSAIDARLKNRKRTIKYQPINSYPKTAFVGVAIQGIGFTVSDEDHSRMLKNDRKNSKVLKRYLVGDDLNQNPECAPTRWIVDFADMPLEAAKQYKLPYDHVVRNVKPHRARVRRAAHKRFWWHYGDKRMQMREAIAPLQRFIVSSIVSKFVLFSFADESVLPSHLCIVVAKDDYFTLGVLNSKFHVRWAWETSSTLESRIRYSNTETYETFPFPTQSSDTVAKIMKEIESYRVAACRRLRIGMTDLYNEMLSGGHQLLRKLHSRLDAAVADCYGYPKSKLGSDEQVLKFLIDLNLGRSDQNAAATHTDVARDRVSRKAKQALEKAGRKIGRKQS